MLKQLLSITVNRLPTKKNKLPFSFSVYGKQTEVCRFYFPFAGAIAPPPPPTITLRYISALSRNASSLLKRVVASVNYHSSLSLLKVIAFTTGGSVFAADSIALRKLQ